MKSDDKVRAMDKLVLENLELKARVNYLSDRFDYLSGLVMELSKKLEGEDETIDS